MFVGGGNVIRLHPVASLARKQTRCHHLASLIGSPLLHTLRISAPWQYVALPAYRYWFRLVILSAADPMGQLFAFLICWESGMTKAAILIDGGYFLKRLPFVPPNVDSRDADAVAQCVDQLIQGHLKQLNKVHNASNFYKLLSRSFFWPYE